MPDHLEVPSDVRRSGTGARHGRPARGPLVLAGPLSPRVRRRSTPAAEFDELVLVVVERCERRWGEAVRAIQFATEDVPLVPAYWKDERVPFAAVSPAVGDAPARIVVFRRPVESHARGRTDRLLLLHEVVLDQLAELWGTEPDELDP